MVARLETGFDMDDGHVGLSTGCETMFELGLRYSAGRDTELDLVQAHMWFNLAALRGHEAAKAYRSEIGRDLSRSEIAKAQRLAREWLRAN